MDTSETYIKMRLAAGCSLGWGVPQEPFECYSYNALDTRGNYSFMKEVGKDVFVDTNGNFFYLTKTCLTQLERQDQLQEMVKDGNPFWKVLQDFLFWFSGSLEIQAQASIKEWTSEQLWLAFVMKERYNKIWSGSEWEKEDD